MKCQCIREIFGLKSVRFVLGDCLEYLNGNDAKFDIVIACGILYHLVEPMTLLSRVAERTDRLFLWTHYFDEELLEDRPEFGQRFSAVQEGTHDSLKFDYAIQHYGGGKSWNGFCGGTQAESVWLTRESIIAALRHFGFETILVGFDEMAHSNGPSFAITATKAGTG